VRRCPLLTLQAPQSADFVALHRMDARGAVLGPTDVQAASIEFDLMPLQIAQLGRPQAVAMEPFIVTAVL
jgi:hypothetical protein